MTFDLDFAIGILPALLDGASITFVATLCGFAIALVGGLVLAVARLSGIRPLAALASVYVEFVRDTPLLIQLFFLYYCLPYVGITLPALGAGILGLGLHYSAYTAEVYRAGIQGVPRGQWEVATALNFSTRKTWTRIVLPQAIPPVIPPLGNYVIGMFKDSVLLATITVLDLFGRAVSEAAVTYRYLEPYTLVGLIFLVLSYSAGILVRRSEVRFGRRQAG
jgi:polar amino acid transport system permease protein